MGGGISAIKPGAGLVVMLLAGALTAAAAEDDAIKTALNNLLVVRDRMLAPYQAPPPAERVRQLRATLKKDGSWPDVNYSGTSTTAWEPAEHLRRLLTLTQAWFAPTSAAHGNAELASEISRALDCWLCKDPRRWWWWDCIGAPGTLSLILLMLDEHLTECQQKKGIEILERAQLSHTGQNLVWQAEITARRAALQRDADLLRRAFDLIVSEIRISSGDGIQADFSFHQHGHCLYNHGYGAGFAQDNARLAALTAGTPFAYPPEKIALLSAYILDGSQWLAFGNHSDFGAEGREITRPGQSALYLGEAAQDMLNVATGRENEFRALAARIAGEQAQPLVGNKHFARSDIMVHHRPGWYMSARMYSERTLNTDGLSGCDEGLLGHYLAEGATCLMSHGNEYLDIFPVWDWQRVPGTTVELAPHQPGEPSRKGESAFAGGASDGTVGVAAFHLKRDSLRARKAWFFFSNAAVCLGTGIHGETDYPVVTTLNQCRLRGPVTVGRDGTEVEVPDEGEHTLDARWIWHDGIGYLFDKVTPVHLSNASCTGNWKRISAQRSSDPVTDKVFMLGLAHGVRPGGAAYAYAVLPGTEVQTVPGFVREPPFKIAANSMKVQAVYHPGDAAFGLVFHEAGPWEWQKWRVVVDRPCVLVIRREQAGWRLAVADPAAGSDTMRVELTRPDGRTQGMNVKLPEGQNGGASTIVRLEQDSSGREGR